MKEPQVRVPVFMGQDEPDAPPVGTAYVSDKEVMIVIPSSAIRRHVGIMLDPSMGGVKGIFLGVQYEPAKRAPVCDHNNVSHCSAAGCPGPETKTPAAWRSSLGYSTAMNASDGPCKDAQMTLMEFEAYRRQPVGNRSAYKSERQLREEQGINFDTGDSVMVQNHSPQWDGRVGTVRGWVGDGLTGVEFPGGDYINLKRDQLSPAPQGKTHKQLREEGERG